MNKIKRTKKKILDWLEHALDWTDKSSDIKHEDLKIDLVNGAIINAFLITLFCFSFTYSYYNWFGVSYFLHFEYLDIYGFTLGRLSTFYESTFLILLTVMSSLGFHLVGDKKFKGKFSNMQKIILLFAILVPIFFIISLTYKITGSIYKVFVNTIIMLGLLMSIYFQRKEKHDMFLIGIITMLMYFGSIFGKSFAKDRFKTMEYIDLIDSSNGEKKLKKHHLIIGQNKTQFIVIDRTDTTCIFIPKKDNIKVQFKGRVKDSIEIKN